MVRLDSYLRGPDGSFTTIDTVTDAPDDPGYVEGAIEREHRWHLRRAVASETELVGALHHGAVGFFERIGELVPAPRYGSRWR